MTVQQIITKANLLYQVHRFAEAEALCLTALEAEPNHAGIKFNLATAIHRQPNRIADAAAAYGDVILTDGEWPEEKAAAANNMGLLCMEMNKLEESRQCFMLALSLVEEYPMALNNLGNYFLWKGEYVEANKWFDEALKLDADLFDSRMNCGTIKLLTGDLPGGWKDYEYRWKASNLQTIPIVQKKPRWKGEPLEGKTILLTSEQGLGDAIMGIRYAQLVKDRYRPARILHHGHKETVDLFAGVPSLGARTAEPNPNDIDPDSYDYHCPLFSLPAIFDTRLGNVPAEVPYISVDGKMDLPDNGKPKVGLVWAGSPRHAKDCVRSVNLSMFEPLLELDADFYGMQVGARSEQVKDYPQVTDLGSQLKSLTDTAKALKALDLLISVDTMVVHLAGAMALPCWVMVYYNPDWRWMLTRPDSPWYPTLRLFRQAEESGLPIGDEEQRRRWEPVVERIKNEYVQEFHPVTAV